MIKKYFKLSRLSCIVPEAIALVIILNTVAIAELSYFSCSILIYSFILRFTWQSAIIIHGWGHSIAIALADRNLSALNLTNILEQRSISQILKSLIPFNYILILSPSHLVPQSPHLKVGKPNNLRLKASAGILLNLAIAFIVIQLPIPSYQSPEWSLIKYGLIFANILLALFSRSDMEAMVTGVAEYLYCGNFGLIALRQPEDEPSLLPSRLQIMAQQMGQETEVRGEQAGGGLVIGKQDNLSVFVGQKIVNQKRSNLTISLEAAFAKKREKAIARGIKPMDAIVGVWHYRYGTSGTVPSKLETHWHDWMAARKENVWRFTGKKWICETKNVHHRITHNGDFNSWRIFNRDVDYKTFGLWLERVLHTPNATQGDSPKIAGMMDLLITQGNWYAAVRLAYQQAIADSVSSTFGSEKPTKVASNTAPSQEQLKAWANIFEDVFQKEIAESKNRAIDPVALKASHSLHQAFNQGLKNLDSTAKWTDLQYINFIQATLTAFLENDLYRATQIFMMGAKGSFGLVTVSTLSESELVLSAKEQPITIGFDWERGCMVYASEPAAVDRILLHQPQSFRLDLDAANGEVAKVSAKDIKIYSLLHEQQLGVLHLKDRWISMTENHHLEYIKFAATDQDPIAKDIQAIPQTLQQIKTSWQNPSSLNRRSADYLIYLFTEKVQRFEKKQRLMFQAGLVSQIRTLPTVDILITGEENSLWLGQKFAQDFRTVFPFLNIVTNSANEILQQLDTNFAKLNLNRDSLIFAITQSGQTFSTSQVIKVFDHLSSQGIIGELFIFTGELSSFINSTQGKGGLTTITNSSFVDSENDHRYRIFVNGSGRRTAEASTVTVAATAHTLTELLLYVAQQMRQDFPHSTPLGMTLNPESLMVLAMMKEDFISKNVPQIIGISPEGKPLKSPIKTALINNGEYWAKHVTETPLAWAIQTLYIIISVGWIIPFGHTLPLVKTLFGELLGLFNLPLSINHAIAPLITIADIGVYIFGAWLWTLALRYIQSRQLLARTGKRTLIIGDISWLNRLLQAYVSKLFALSYGIATIEIHSADPQNHLLHDFGHRVVRGTLIWLGIPDGRRSTQQQVAESAVIMTGKQANGIKNFNMGAEIVVLAQNPTISPQGFNKSLILNSNNDAIYFRSIDLEQREQIEQLRESYFSSIERLLASYIFFWALGKKVASFPLLKYQYWKSQSRTKVMTTASPVGGIDIFRINGKSDRQTSGLPTLK